MSDPAFRRVLVVDIGKTNAKVLLFDRDARREVVSVTRPNGSRPEPPYTHFDVPALERLLIEGLREAASAAPVDAVVVATHGASAALVGDDGLVLPPLDYDDPGPDALAAAYDALRPPFAATGSPRFAGGLNVGAQLFWQRERFPEAFAAARRLLMWPQYWTWRLCGVAASEVTSLASHTDLWDLRADDLSELVDRLGIRHLFPPRRRANEVLGTLLPEFAEPAAIDYPIPVLCGVHDSNAALVPYLLPVDVPRTIVSTGTWITAFALGSEPDALPAEDGVMASVDVLGRIVPNFRFPGGRVFDRLAGGAERPSSEPLDQVRSEGLRARLEGDELRVVDRDGNAVRPETLHADERAALASAALADHTARGIGWIGGAGETLVMGPFARNQVYLSRLRRNLDGPVRAELRHGGISEGAAMLTALN